MGRTATKAQEAKARARQARLALLVERNARDERIEDAAASVLLAWDDRAAAQASVEKAERVAAAALVLLGREKVPVRDMAALTGQVVRYSWATVAMSLALVPIASMGWIYLVAAVVSGGVFLLEAHRLLARAEAVENVTVASLKPMRLFHYSISYLTILFLAVAVDPLLHLALP